MCICANYPVRHAIFVVIGKRSVCKAVLSQRKGRATGRSEEHTSELPSQMRTSYVVFCLQKTTDTRRHATLLQPLDHHSTHTNQNRTPLEHAHLHVPSEP